MAAAATTATLMWFAATAVLLAPKAQGASRARPVQAAAAKAEFPPAEAKGREQVAKAWGEFAKWCAEHGQRAAGDVALAAATSAGLADKAATSLRDALAKLDVVADRADDPALATKRKEVHLSLAKLHGKRFDLALRANAPDRAEAALREQLALDADPKGARSDFAALLKAADEAKWNEVAARWLERARVVDPDGHAAGKFAEATRSLGKRDVMLVGGRVHPLVAYVSLPPDWTPKSRELPVVVAVEGAGSNFAGCCRAYRDTRGSRAAIAISPCTFANTNELDATKYPWYDAATLKENSARGDQRIKFDSEGVAAVLAELRRDWGAGERLAITGFSGGGNLTYWWALQHPEQLALAVGCCANYSGLGAAGAKPPADGGPPIHLLTGEKDEYNLEVNGQKPGINGQTDAIEQQLTKLGWKNVTRRVVPGAGHSNFAADVWALFLGK